MYYVGIDFGSCFSKITIIDGDDHKKWIILDYDHDIGIPTEIAYFGNDRFSFGNNIKSDLSKNPNHILIKDIKTKLRDNLEGEDYFIDRFIPYTELARRYLTYIFEEFIFDKIDRDTDTLSAITMTVPIARHSEKESAAIYHSFLKSTVASISGVSKENVFVQTEPVCAALSYFESINNERESVLIFDLGGSTLDLAVVECNRKKYSVKCFGGNNIGSNSWNVSLKHRALDGMGIDVSSVPKSYDSVIDQEIEKCKISFSSSDEFTLNLPLGTKRYKLKIDDFDKCTEKEINASKSLLLSVIKEYDSMLATSTGLRELGSIILVGGGTKTRSVNRLIVDSLEKSHQSVNLKSHRYGADAISRGAALFSQLVIDNDVSSDIGFNGVALHTYGVDVYSPEGKYIDNIIFKGQEFDSNGLIIGRTKKSIKINLEDKRDVVFDIYESDIIPDNPGISKVEKFDENVFVRSPIQFKYKIDDFNISDKNKINIFVEMRLSSKDNIVSLRLLDEKGKLLLSENNDDSNQISSSEETIKELFDEYVNVRCSDNIKISKKSGNVLCQKMKEYDLVLNFNGESLNFKIIFYQDCELTLKGSVVDFELNISSASDNSILDKNQSRIYNDSLDIKFNESLVEDNPIFRQNITHNRYTHGQFYHDTLKFTKLIKVRFYTQGDDGRIAKYKIIETVEGKIPVPPPHIRRLKHHPHCPEDIPMYNHHKKEPFKCIKGKSCTGNCRDYNYYSYFVEWSPELSPASETSHCYEEIRDHSEKPRCNYSK